MAIYVQSALAQVAMLEPSSEVIAAALLTPLCGVTQAGRRCMCHEDINARGDALVYGLSLSADILERASRLV